MFIDGSNVHQEADIRNEIIQFDKEINMTTPDDYLASLFDDSNFCRISQALAFSYNGLKNGQKDTRIIVINHISEYFIQILRDIFPQSSSTDLHSLNESIIRNNSMSVMPVMHSIIFVNNTSGRDDLLFFIEHLSDKNPKFKDKIYIVYSDSYFDIPKEYKLLSFVDYIQTKMSPPLPITGEDYPKISAFYRDYVKDL